MSSSDSYKKGEGYNCLAGRDASRALAVMSLQPQDCVSKIDDISEEEVRGTEPCGGSDEPHPNPKSLEPDLILNVLLNPDGRLRSWRIGSLTLKTKRVTR